MSKRAALLGYVLLVVLMSAGAAQSLSGTNTVDSGDIIAGEVKGSDIAANVITGDKVKDGSITPFDIKDGVLGGPDVANNSLTGDDINESTLNLTAETPHVVAAASSSLDCESNPGRFCKDVGVVSGGAVSYGEWTNEGYPSVTYAKDPMGYVHLAGLAHLAAVTAVGGDTFDIFILPAGYRPSTNVDYTIICDGDPNFVTIKPNGEVSTDCNEGYYVLFDGLTFRAAS